jgi:hypothetical protein
MLPSVAVPTTSSSFSSLSASPSNGMMVPAAPTMQPSQSIPAPTPAPLPATAPSSIASGSPNEQPLSLPTSMADGSAIPGQQQPATGASTSFDGVKTWSSLDGIQRSAAWDNATASEGILQSSQLNMHPPSRPGSTQPTAGGAGLLASQSLDGMPRPGPMNGLPNGLPGQGLSGGPGANSLLPGRTQSLQVFPGQQTANPNGLNLSQQHQQLLHQHLLMQQQQQRGKIEVRSV